MPEVSSVNLLLVDDKIENLIALESLLKDENTRIFKVQSGEEALELLLKHEFALALLDVQMPGMDGFELAELMRMKEKTRSIPIIFVTAGAIDPKHTFQGYEAGAVDFLYKPLDMRVVRSKVRVFRELEFQRQIARGQAESLARALEAREDFISIASHEIKTPITSLQLQLQVMRRHLTAANLALPPKLTHGLENALKQIKKLNQVIDEMLDVSRIQGNKFFVHLESTNLSELVKNTVLQLEDQIEHAGCPIELEVEPEIWVECDAFRTEQVLTNLLTNVLKYAPGAKCTISLSRVGQHAVLKVQDQGPGIAHSKLSAIFDRFERIDNQQAVSGLGLGLYIAKQTVEAQGGTIRAESDAGKGTTFLVNFPVV